MRRSFPGPSSQGPTVGVLLLVTAIASVVYAVVGRSATLVPCHADDIPEAQALRSALDFVGPNAGEWHLVYRVDGDYVFKDAGGQRSLRVDGANGCIRAYDCARTNDPADTGRVSMEDAERRALSYVGRAGIGIDVAELVARERSAESDGRELRFLFSTYRNGVELPVRVDARIDAATGELLGYAYASLMPVRISLEPTVSEEEAARAALVSCGRLKEPQVAGSHLFVWRAYWLVEDPAAPLPEEQALLWRVKVRGAVEEMVPTALHGMMAVDVETVLEVDVDAHTGDVRLCVPAWRESPDSVRAKLPAEPRSYSVGDHSPAWASSGNIYFGSSRTTKAVAEDYQAPERSASIFRVDTDSGELMSLAPYAFTYAPICPAPSPDGHYLAFTHVRNCGLLDLRTGAIGRIGYRLEGGQEPAWHPAGKWIAVTANRRGTQDIFRVNLDLSRLESGGTSALSQMEASQTHALFSPDGSWLAFATAHYPQPMEAEYSVWVLPLDAEGAPTEGARCVVSHLADLHSLSTYPDGQRLLVGHRTGPSVLNTATGELSSLHWPKLHDPDLPDGDPLMIRGVALSPSGDQVAFSGLRWSGDPEDEAGCYIYVCDLDGSNLKRVTPLEDAPVEAYVYPDTGKNAFDVAAEIRAKFER